MANEVIGDYDAATGIDGSTHFLLIQPGSASTAYKRINRNVLLGVNGQPMDISTTQTVGNKTLSNTNSVTTKDGSFTLQNTSDTTKQARFSLSTITTGTLATYILPGASDTLVGASTTATLSAKTLSGPIINGGSIDNSTISVDAIIGHTTANTGSIYGLDITTGKIDTPGIDDGAITAPKLSLTATAYVNTGSAGGTFYYINLGGIKWFWGKTDSVAITGSGFQSTARTVNFPSGFFTTIQTITHSVDIASASQYLSSSLLSRTDPDSFDFYLNQNNGTDGSSPVDIMVIGT